MNPECHKHHKSGQKPGHCNNHMFTDNIEMYPNVLVVSQVLGKRDAPSQEHTINKKWK
jgi:hypothetical protein